MQPNILQQNYTVNNVNNQNTLVLSCILAWLDQWFLPFLKSCTSLHMRSSKVLNIEAFPLRMSAIIASDHLWTPVQNMQRESLIHDTILKKLKMNSDIRTWVSQNSNPLLRGVCYVFVSCDTGKLSSCNSDQFTSKWAIAPAFITCLAMTVLPVCLEKEAGSPTIYPATCLLSSGVPGWLDIRLIKPM